MTDAAVGRVHDLFNELGIEIDPQLLELALTHRSWAYENGGTPHNERLEFLGDSVLGVVAGVAYPGSLARSKKLAEQGAAKLAHEALAASIAGLAAPGA